MKTRRPVIQLTALLDLLFIMIFVSLNQTKTAVPVAKEDPAPVVVEKTVAPAEKPVAEPTAPSEPKELLVTAQFHFYGASGNPGVATGKYIMKGTFERDSGVLQLGGTSWIERPRNYDMVPLTGTIDEDRLVFRGRIEFEGCEQFELRRTEKKSGSAISGTWKGVYSCLQGQTGLTLTIF